jgi:hypothetical protein
VRSLVKIYVEGNTENEILIKAEKEWQRYNKNDELSLPTDSEIDVVSRKLTSTQTDAEYTATVIVRTKVDR